MDNASRIADHKAALDQINFIAYNWLALVICAIGILGNIVSLVVLTRPNMKVSMRIIHPPGIQQSESFSSSIMPIA